MSKFSRTFTVFASVACASASLSEQDIYSDSEALQLLQTQARPNYHRHSSDTDTDTDTDADKFSMFREAGDPPDPKVSFDAQGDLGPRAESPPGSIKADYDVQAQSPQSTQNLKFAKIAYRNLGGLGPHTDRPENVYYKNVAKTLDGTPVDMILESTNFKTAKPKKVGLFGKSAVINVQNGNEVDFTARFVDKEGNSIPLGPFHISFMDIDTGKEGAQEELTIGGFSKSYMLDDTELTEVKMNDGRTKFVAGLPGAGADNPYDPLMLTDVQAKRTVSLQFPGGLSTFSFSYKVAEVAYEDYDAESEGRHFFISGMSSLYFCEAKPVVIDYNMASVQYSNLGGMGPDFDSPKGLRFDNIAVVQNDETLDMIITNQTKYQPTNTTNNGLNGQFAQLNIGGGTNTKFRFTFVKHGSDEPYKMDWVYMSIFDLDHGKKKEQYRETLEIKGFVTHYLTETSELHVHKHGDKWYTYGSTTWGTGSDNPTNPMNLTQLQKDRSVTLLYHDISSFDAQFGAMKPKKYGRNFLFAGKSEMVFC